MATLMRMLTFIVNEQSQKSQVQIQPAETKHRSLWLRESAVEGINNSVRERMLGTKRECL